MEAIRSVGRAMESAVRSVSPRWFKAEPPKPELAKITHHAGYGYEDSELALNSKPSKTKPEHIESALAASYTGRSKSSLNTKNPNVEEKHQVPIKCKPPTKPTMPMYPIGVRPLTALKQAPEYEREPENHNTGDELYGQGVQFHKSRAVFGNGLTKNTKQTGYLSSQFQSGMEQSKLGEWQTHPSPSKSIEDSFVVLGEQSLGQSFQIHSSDIAIGPESQGLITYHDEAMMFLQESFKQWKSSKSFSGSRLLKVILCQTTPELAVSSWLLFTKGFKKFQDYSIKKLSQQPASSWNTRKDVKTKPAGLQIKSDYLTNLKGDNPQDWVFQKSTACNKILLEAVSITDSTLQANGNQDLRTYICLLLYLCMPSTLPNILYTEKCPSNGLSALYITVLTELSNTLAADLGFSKLPSMKTANRDQQSKLVKIGTQTVRLKANDYSLFVKELWKALFWAVAEQQGPDTAQNKQYSASGFVNLAVMLGLDKFAGFVFKICIEDPLLFHEVEHVAKNESGMVKSFFIWPFKDALNRLFTNQKSPTTTFNSYNEYIFHDLLQLNAK